MKTLCHAEWKDSGRKIGRAEKSKNPIFLPNSSFCHQSLAKLQVKVSLPAVAATAKGGSNQSN
jgi:hypothetical protein